MLQISTERNWGVVSVRDERGTEVQKLTCPLLRDNTVVSEDELAAVRQQIHKAFCEGDIEVLVASPAMALGVDGLQQRCNRMIFLSLPWTFAAYEQIVGRI